MNKWEEYEEKKQEITEEDYDTAIKQLTAELNI